MTFTHTNAVRRHYPRGQWRDELPNPSRKALEAIARTAVVVLEYITPATAAIAGGVPLAEADAYLELLADLRIVSEPLSNDRQHGRAVFVDRKDWAATQTRLRAIPLHSTNHEGNAA